jgi:ribosome-associated protein
MDMREISFFTDYFIICSGKSDRQVQGIADSVETEMKKNGISPLGIEGFTEGKWILLDYSDVVVHVFYAPIREFYDLERLWSDAPRIELES